MHAFLIITEILMPSLQIRNLPDDVYQFLAFRAEQEHRSLAQQAIVELRKATEGAMQCQRRRQILRDIKRSLEKDKIQKLTDSPEDLIRQDRDR
jgi:plasmid stability protein